MDVRHFAFLAHQPSARVNTRERFCGMPKRGLAFVLANVMFWQPVWAQADGIVVANPGTSLGQAGNGVPIVNIATPNGSGLSHNQFHDYNVGAHGVILNNGATQTSATQLGGIIIGNPNLKNSGSAQTILNEVVGGSPSQLRGYTEVAGQSARVIVANPYGISCNGCGFINTPRVTLTTGKPVLDGNGRLDRFQVDQGSVSIDGAGLNANNVDRFEIITRSAKINAEIQANNLTIVAGRNDVNADSLNATARADDGSAKPQLAIDSSALGGMYAGAIKLVGTEAGVGVKLDGKLIASGGDIQLDANGQLSMVETSASGAVKVKAGSLDARGPVYAGTAINVQTQGNLTNQQTLAARDSITLSAGGQLTNNGIIEAGVNADNSRNANGDISLSAQNLGNAGKSVVASRNLTVATTQTLNNQGGTLSGQSANINAGVLDNRNNGRVLSNSTLNLKADQLHNAKGVINSNGNLAGNVGGLNNSEGQLSSLADVVLNVASLDNVAGLMTAGRLLDITASGAINNQSGTLSGVNELKLDTKDTFGNQGGKVLSNGSLSLELNGRGLDNQAGQINAKGMLSIANLRDLNNQKGEISSLNSFSLKGDTLDNRGGKLISHDHLTLDAANLQNQGGLISGWKAVTITGGTLDNSQEGALSSLLGQLSVDLSGALINNAKGGLGGKGGVSLNAASIDNSAQGLIDSSGTLELSASSINNASGTINAQGALNVTATNLDNTDGRLAGAGSVTLDLLGVLTNTKGVLSSAGPLVIKRSGQIDNLGGQLISQQLMSLRTGQLNNHLQGTVASNQQLDLIVTGDLNNSEGGLIHSRNAGVSVSALGINNTKGAIQSHDALTLNVQGGTVDNQHGEIIARTGDLNISAAVLDNRGGSLSSLKGLTQNRLTGVLRNGQGGKIEGNRLDLQALGGIYTEGGRIAANAGDILLDTGGSQLDNSGGGIYAEGQVKVVGGALKNNAGEISGRSIDIDLADDLSNQDGLIESASTLKLNASSVNNQGGKLRALGRNGKTDFQIGRLFDNRNGLLETANTQLTLATSSFLNSGGNVTHVGIGNFDIDMGNVMGAGGTLVTRGDLTLEANSWTNTSVIQAARLKVNVNNFVQTASGQLLASNHFEGRGGSWTNDGVIASDGTLDVLLSGTYGGNGRMSSLGDMQFDSAAINLGSAGSVSSGGNTTVGARGALATLNNYGRLTAANGLTLKANTVNNFGTLAGGTGFKLSASRLLNDQGGFLFSGGDMALRVESFTNRKSDVYSLGAIDIARDDAGNRAALVENLSGTMESVGRFSIKSDLIVNKRDQFSTQAEMYSSAIGVRCYSCDELPRSWVDRQPEWHLVFEQKYRVNVSGDSSSPAALMTSGSNMDLVGTSFLNSNSTVAATGNLSITVNDFDNSGTALGDYSSLQYFNYEGPRYRNRLEPFSEIVRYNIFNDADYKKNMHFWNAAGVESLIYPRIGVQGAKPFEKEFFQIIGPVVLLLGGGTAALLPKIDFADSQYSSGARTELPDFLKNATPFNQVITSSGTTSDIPAVIQSGGEVSINAKNKIGNGVERPFSSGMSSQQRAADIAASGTGSPTVVTLNGQLPADLAQQQVNPLTLPGFNIPTGQNGLFRLSDQSGLGQSAPGPSASMTDLDVTNSLGVPRVQGLLDNSFRSKPHKYLIETNPVLTDLKQFMSSDYLLSNLGYNPDISAKRLGDGFYEQRLIQQAVVARTGQRFLDGQTSDEAMFKYLMNNAIASKDQLSLSVGVTLTSQQVAALTHDIVWLEAHEVNGEKVLVPVLYLAQANNRLAPNGALIQGGDVTLIAGQDLSNSGTLRATNNLAAYAAQDLTSSGLIEAGNRLDLLAGNNIINKSGGVIAGRDVTVKAVSGDVINERTITSAEFSNKGYTQHRDYLDNAARIEATNDLSIVAGRDVLSSGSVIQSGRDTQIEAGRDISIVSAEQQRADTGGKQKSSVTQFGSSLEAGRDIAMSAGRDFTAIASDVNAKRNIDLAAEGNVTIASGADETHSYYKSKKVTAQEDHVKQIASTFNAGGDVVLSAGNDLTVISSRITAGNEAYLVAGNNLELLAAQDSDYSLYDKKKKGSFGQKETRRDEITKVTHVGSEITTGGDLTLVSGGDQRYQVAKLNSGNDLTLQSGGAITFEGVKDLHQESHEKSSNSLAWTSAKGKGNTDETLRQSQLVAQGNLAIKAVDGLNIDIKQIDQKTVGQTIDAMVQADPSLIWLKQMEQRGDVDWLQVKEVHDSFKYSNSGLGAGAMIVIAIVIAALTAGVGTAGAGAAMTGATSTAGVAASNAVYAAAATNATTSTINNRGNLGKVYDDVTSRDALKSYVVTGVTAGLTAGLYDKWTGTQTGSSTVANAGTNSGGSLLQNTAKVIPGAGLSSWSGVGQFAANQALQNTTSTLLNKALGQGGSLGEALQTSLVSTFAAAGFNLVGDIGYDYQLKTGSPAMVGMHALIGGLAAKASGGDFATGALAAGASEALVGSLARQLESMPGSKQNNLLVMSAQLVGVLVAATQGNADAESLGTAAWVAKNGVQYNYLNDHEMQSLAKDLAGCELSGTCDQVAQRYFAKHEINDKALNDACGGKTTAACQAKAAEIYDSILKFRQLGYGVELEGKPAEIFKAFHGINLDSSPIATAGIATPQMDALIDALGLDSKSVAGIAAAQAMAVIIARKVGAKAIDNSVIGRPRVGSANKLPDGQHGFNEIIDNYAGDAVKFEIPTKGPGGEVIRVSELRQIEGSNNGVGGIFEWIVDEGNVTHRRFIPGGQVTGLPNQIPKK
ncbi:DUF637 domain-containing protein [Pseudomonas sp. TNT2022 ID1044]|uniref:two-partner secretion domain-containing protein n=1 Tax=Pseudomonas sp. TNT2022 ID1044 TaxID=2942636 RepID=UPI00235DFD45|nr:DUF637 domain-containing protein [Pseudomonas sp. TNT2022 ID1044]MDD0994746.1 DUF637 domain-containing protein [Pseudomonas sp. TNT2022 ID1044]